jgi:hypothetical protein
MSSQSYSCIGYTLHSFAPNITLKILNFCKSVILLPSMLSLDSSHIDYMLRSQAPNIRLALSHFFGKFNILDFYLVALLLMYYSYTS